MPRRALQYQPYPNANGAASAPSTTQANLVPARPDYRPASIMPARENEPFAYTESSASEQRASYVNTPFFVPSPALAEASRPTFAHGHQPGYNDRPYAPQVHGVFQQHPISIQNRPATTAPYSESVFSQNPPPVPEYAEGPLRSALNGNDLSYQPRAIAEGGPPHMHNSGSKANASAHVSASAPQPSQARNAPIGPPAQAQTPSAKPSAAKRKRPRPPNALPPAEDAKNSSVERSNGAAPAPNTSAASEKTVYAVIISDISPVPVALTDPDDEIRVQTMFVAGTYSTKAAANGAAWTASLQGHPKSEFDCRHTLVDGCSRIEINGLSPLQEEPKNLTNTRAKSRLVAQVTPVTVPDVPLNVTTKEDVVYIVSLMSDDGVVRLQAESNTEVIGVYHSYGMAKWHAYSTLTKYYGPDGCNALSMDRTVKGKDVLLRFEVREGPNVKIIEVSKRRVGGPMSNTWTSQSAQSIPNIHGSPAVQNAAGASGNITIMPQASPTKSEDPRKPGPEEPADERTLADLLRTNGASMKPVWTRP